MKTVHVALKDRSYAVHIGRNLLADAGTYLTKAGLSGRRCVIVTQKILTRALYRNTDQK